MGERKGKDRAALAGERNMERRAMEREKGKEKTDGLEQEEGLEKGEESTERKRKERTDGHG
jgi:hypothetical protein